MLIFKTNKVKTQPENNRWIFSILIEKNIEKKRFLMSKTNSKGEVELRPLSEDELGEIYNILRNIELYLQHTQEFPEYKLIRYVPVIQSEFRLIACNMNSVTSNN